MDSIFKFPSIPYVWKSRAKPTNAGEAKYRPQIVAEFVYQNANCSDLKYFPLNSGEERKYPHQDEYGKYRTTTILTSNLGRYQRETMRFEINGYTPPPEKRWKAGEDEIKWLLDNHRLGFNDDGEPYRKHYEGDEEEQHIPLWTYIPEEISSTAENGKSDLSAIIGNNHGIDTVKPKELIMYFINSIVDKRDIVLDYFAGSGTTGHAVINLNREDGGNRKYILVEMGNYFNTVTKPRIKKVVYAKDWKDGKPQNRNTGVSQIFKYIRLESYEDTLNNIELSRTPEQEKQLRMDASFFNEYLVSYMLDIESRGSLLNLDRFKEPFAYKMKIAENNETKETTIDLVETFNYLLGLVVTRQKAATHFNAVPDEKGEYENAVILTEDKEGKYTFKTVEGIMPNGDKALVIWRNLTDDLAADNAALDAFFTKYRAVSGCKELNSIYVNGDNNLENLKGEKEQWKVHLIELEFKKRMFEGV